MLGPDRTIAACGCWNGSSTSRHCPREVLGLICEGRTNGEISGRLFISVKTVDHHVSAVLGELGVDSRKVAATEAVRRGLVGI